MNWLDFVILAILGWFAFTGLSAGILREGVTFLSAVLGTVLAGLLYRRLADDLSFVASSQNTRNIVAFVAIFAAIFLAGQVIAILLKQTASVLMLGSIDRTFGLLFGLLKAFVVIEVALFLFATHRLGFITNAIGGSLFSPIFLDGLPLVLALLPEQFTRAVERFNV